MASVNFSEESKMSINLSKQEPLKTNVTDINYIPSYKVAELERQANEKERQANEKERETAYNKLTEMIDEGKVTGIYIGEEQPTDEFVDVWIDPNGNPEVEAKHIMFSDQETLQQKYENGELKGDKGDTGYTPIKGTDYFTKDEINEIKEDTKTELKANTLVVSSTKPTTGEEVWIQRRKNLFNKNNVTGGFRFDSKGLPYAEKQCSISEFIKVNPNTDYVVNFAINYLNTICYYDESKTFILRNDLNSSFVTPSNCEYIRFSRLTTELDITQLEQGSTATSYEPYGSKDINVKTNDEYEKITDTVSLGTSSNGAKIWFEKGKNLINLEQLANYNLNETTGALESNNTRLVTPYMFLKKGTYTINCNLSRFAYVIYNTDYSFNSFISWQTFPNKIILNSDCYIRVEIIKDYNGAETISKTDITYLQLESGEVATSYEPYIDKKIYTKTYNGYEEFYNENPLTIPIYFNENHIYSNDREYLCFRIGNIVFLQLRVIGFIDSPANNEVLIYGLPKPKTNNIFYLHGGNTAQGDSARCRLNDNGEIVIHYGSPSFVGDSSNNQYGGVLMYETAD